MAATYTTTLPAQVAEDLTEFARIAGQRVDVEAIDEAESQVTLTADLVDVLRGQRPEDDFVVDADDVMWAAGMDYQLA